MGAALYLLAPTFISLMGATGEFAAQAVAYMRIYAVFSPVTTILFAVDNFLRICGYIKGSLGVNVVFVVIGTALEFTLLGPLDWGVEGAAGAYSTAMLVGSLIAFIPFFRGKATLRFTRPRPTGAVIRQIVSCGAPTFLNNIAGRALSNIMNIILVRLGGETAVSTWGVLMYVDGFVQPLLYGMCDSLQPSVGYNWGARRFDRVWAIERWCFGTAFAVSVVCGAAIIAAPGPIASLFIAGGDAEALSMTVEALRIFGLTYLTRWLSYVAQACLLALEMALPASILSLSTALVVPLVLIAVF